MRLQTKEQTEDFMHDVIAMILTRVDKSNIRPAFQKTSKSNPAGKNYISQDGLKNGLEGFTNLDNFIYFKVLENNDNSSLPEVEPDDSATYIKTVELTVYIYGEEAQQNALLLTSLIRTNRVQNYLNLNGYFQLDDQNINPLSEIINGQWWDRVDVTLNFNCRIDLPVAREDQIEYAKKYNTGELPEIVGGNNNGIQSSK